MIFKSIKVSLVLACLFTAYANGHADHGKARYVAPDGKDQGNCDNIEQPCLTIGFAAGLSNKGDVVKVAKGSYTISDIADVFYLTNDLIEVRGGYDKLSGFKSAKPKQNEVFISGVPKEFHAQFIQKGFTPILDAKALSAEARQTLNKKLASVKALNESQTEVTCQNGQAGEFACSNMDLVAHIPLTQMAGKPDSANDIWGHVDLNTGKEYAIIGVLNGVAIFDISTPSAPVEVSFITAPNAGWRDIKVYQYFSTAENLWKAYAYSSADGSSQGMAIIDLSFLPEARLVRRDSIIGSQHNIYISNVDYSTGVAINDDSARLHSLGATKYGGGHNSFDLINPEKPTAAYIPTDNTRADYTHDGASMMVEDQRAVTQCEQAGGRCDVFLDFNENEMRLWDQTVPSNTKELGSISYQGAQYTHSGWYTEDKNYVYLHDELDEVRNGNNTTVYVFDVQDLTAPTEVGKWVGPTTSIDHNGYVRGNRYYMSNYERGITVLDISNPANPVTVGYFDTFPVGDRPRFNGAWGVYPFLPSGLILASDINSGLYILRDNTRDVPQGKIELSPLTQEVEEGTAATFTISRIDGSTGAVSVQYETLHQSATGDDYTSSTGTVSWADGDTSSKEIVINTTLDTLDDEGTEQFIVRLINVQGGATLSTQRSVTAQIAGTGKNGTVQFSQAELTVYENVDFDNGSKVFELEVLRRFGDEGPVEVSVAFDESSDSSALADAEILTPTISWADGDSESKFVQLKINDDDETESVETLVLKFETVTPDNVNAASTTSIQIIDDESNQAPIVTLSSVSFDRQYQLTLSSFATITDDSAELSYLWEVDSQGKNITINNPNELDATISAGEAGEFPVTLTVTDIFGAQGSATATFIVEGQSVPPMGPPPVETQSNSSSGSMPYNPITLLLALGLLAIKRRKN